MQLKGSRVALVLFQEEKTLGDFKQSSDFKRITLPAVLRKQIIKAQMRSRKMS